MQHAKINRKRRPSAELMIEPMLNLSKKEEEGASFGFSASSVLVGRRSDLVVLVSVRMRDVLVTVIFLDTEDCWRWARE